MQYKTYEHVLDISGDLGLFIRDSGEFVIVKNPVDNLDKQTLEIATYAFLEDAIEKWRDIKQRNFEKMLQKQMSDIISNAEEIIAKIKKET